MKLKNIFKKKAARTVDKSGVQILDKKQLEKVIGGAESSREQAGKAHYGASSSG